MSKILKSILIRELTEEERQAVDVVKSRTGLGHACRAVMDAVVSFERTERKQPGTERKMNGSRPKTNGCAGV